MFQVVPPCGGHLGNFAKVLLAEQVSSRAPVWGASSGSSPRLGGALSFKSCPRVGGIATTIGTLRPHERFKSCPRVGGIETGSIITRLWMVSSRAPVWGASYELSVQFPPSPVSSRAPVWGASIPEHRQAAGQSGFKSCPRVGGILRRTRR